MTLDPDGAIGDADKFLWLAQLSEHGGRDSVEWFSRGATVLRREIAGMGAKAAQGERDRKEGKPPSQSQAAQLQAQEDEKRKNLAGALCGIIEVYMTDLSWELCAEARCERLISEALLVAPKRCCAEPLQTLASVRISQRRIAEAREALRDSLAVWRDLGPDDNGDDGGAAVPDFATRVSLARLLMEVGMEKEAVGVVERLVLEDDGCVEAWYLGGWCLYLLGVRQGEKKEEQGEGNGVAGEADVMEGVNGDGNGDGEERGEEEQGEEDLYTQFMVSSREWLQQSLKLYEMVEYEDERLKEHAMELVAELDEILEGEGEDEGDGREEEEEEEEWDGFERESEEEREDEMDEG